MKVDESKDAWRRSLRAHLIKESATAATDRRSSCLAVSTCALPPLASRCFSLALPALNFPRIPVCYYPFFCIAWALSADLVPDLGSPTTVKLSGGTPIITLPPDAKSSWTRLATSN